MGIVCLLCWLVIVCFSMGRAAAASGPYQRALRDLTTTLQWDWADTVPLREQSRSAFQDYVRQALNRMYSDHEREALQWGYRLLGFLESNTTLEQHLLELYREQAGAYYDPERGTIFELEGDLPASGRYFLYLHEGVHAYQDQRYDLKSIQERVRRSGSLDRSLAFSFVIEGHANLVATAALMNQSVADRSFYQSPRIAQFISLFEKIGQWDPSRMSVFKGMLEQSSGPLAAMLQQLENTPAILLHQLMDPYFVGQKLWYQRAQNLGWVTAEQWFRTFPRSTVAVLYGTNPTPADDWMIVPNRIQSRTSTSLGVYILLRWMDRLMERPSWGGKLASDRVDVIGADGDRALLWQLRFSTPSARRNFLDSLDRLLSTKSPGSGVWKRQGRQRFVRVYAGETTVTLLVDDETDPAPELGVAGLEDLMGNISPE